MLLHDAHRALETMTLSREQSRFKERIAQEYSELVYNGLWYTAHRRDLDAYVDSTQRHVTGDVRVRLHKGSCVVVRPHRRPARSTTTAWPPTTAPTSSTTPPPRASSTSTAYPSAPSAARQGD